MGSGPIRSEFNPRCPTRHVSLEDQLISVSLSVKWGSSECTPPVISGTIKWVWIYKEYLAGNDHSTLALIYSFSSPLGPSP
jgi:hypothetical protein